MFNFLPSFTALITEWGLYALALACLALAIAAFLYIPVFGQWIAICLIALALALIAWSLGYSARGALDNSGAIQAQLDEANRELAATNKVASDFAAAATAAQNDNAQQRDKINAYESTLKAAPQMAGCALSADDVRSLSNIGAGHAPDAARRPSGLRPAGQAAGAR